MTNSLLLEVQKSCPNHWALSLIRGSFLHKLVFVPLEMLSLVLLLVFLPIVVGQEVAIRIVLNYGKVPNNPNIYCSAEERQVIKSELLRAIEAENPQVQTDHSWCFAYCDDNVSDGSCWLVHPMCMDVMKIDVDEALIEAKVDETLLLSDLELELVDLIDVERSGFTVNMMDHCAKARRAILAVLESLRRDDLFCISCAKLLRLPVDISCAALPGPQQDLASIY